MGRGPGRAGRHVAAEGHPQGLLRPVAGAAPVRYLTSHSRPPPGLHRFPSARPTCSHAGRQSSCLDPGRQPRRRCPNRIECGWRGGLPPPPGGLPSPHKRIPACTEWSGGMSVRYPPARRYEPRRSPVGCGPGGNAVPPQSRSKRDASNLGTVASSAERPSVATCASVTPRRGAESKPGREAARGGGLHCSPAAWRHPTAPRTLLPLPPRPEADPVSILAG